jgi:hypothetical protein
MVRMERLKCFRIATLIVFCLTGFVFGDTATLYSPTDIPEIQFGVGDLQKVLEQKGHTCRTAPISALDIQEKDFRFVIGILDDETFDTAIKAAGGDVPEMMDAEGFSIQITGNHDQKTVWAMGADAVGAMYAGLDLAETIAMDGIEGVQEKECKPYVKKRGLKMNIPLDARTPSYADSGDAAQNNIEVVWDMDFWKAHLDQMARDRYNSITLWSPHPFPSLVQVPDYPDVALDDVKKSKIDWHRWYPKNINNGGSELTTPEILNSLETVKTMTIQEKMAFWRDVMQYGHDRGVEFHFITWNIFVWAADGKYGITRDIHNEVTIDYLRKSVCRNRPETL